MNSDVGQGASVSETGHKVQWPFISICTMVLPIHTAAPFTYGLQPTFPPLPHTITQLHARREALFLLREYYLYTPTLSLSSNEYLAH